MLGEGHVYVEGDVCVEGRGVCSVLLERDLCEVVERMCVCGVVVVEG